MDESIRYMNHEEQEALAVLSGFVFKSEVLDEIIDKYMPHYGLYHKEGNHQTAFCTHCRQEFKIFGDSDCFTVRTAAVGKAKHGERDKCALCGKTITYLADGKGRRNIADYNNFIVFEAVSETQLLAKCIRIKQQFLNPDSGRFFADIDSEIFEYSFYECAKYYFEIGKTPLKFILKSKYTLDGWEYSWKKASKFTEPVFVQSPFGGADNSYYLIQDDEIDNTQFRYIMKEISELSSDQSYRYRHLSSMTVSVLGEYCTHPQIEYLMKAGFHQIVEDKMAHTLCGLRLNWKSNNLKKILGLTAAEIEMLRGWATLEIAHYKELKKYDRKSAPQEIKAVLSRTVASGYQLYYFVRDDLITKYGETCRSIDRYISKGTASLRDWKDYLDQCRQLEYDLEDPAIWKPRDLAGAHERLTQIIKTRATEELECKIRELAEERALYTFYDEEYDLIIRAPESVQEIIDEGKALVHCVAGYADRHVRGQLTILFIRKAEEPDVPFYTMEVSDIFYIVQCRGYKNNRTVPKPKYIEDFEKKYEKYLDEIEPVIEKMRADREKEIKKINKKSRKTA